MYDGEVIEIIVEIRLARVKLGFTARIFSVINLNKARICHYIEYMTGLRENEAANDGMGLNWTPMMDYPVNWQRTRSKLWRLYLL